MAVTAGIPPMALIQILSVLIGMNTPVKMPVTLTAIRERIPLNTVLTALLNGWTLFLEKYITVNNSIAEQMTVAINWIVSIKIPP